MLCAASLPGRRILSSPVTKYVIQFVERITLVCRKDLPQMAFCCAYCYVYGISVTAYGQAGMPCFERDIAR